MPCIQDRLRSLATRSKEIFASWPIICQQIILIVLILPEILNRIFGKEIINILPEFTLEIKINFILGTSMALFTAMQYKVNKSLLRIEEQRIQPRLYAEISSDKPSILIENRGGGIAWGCIITLSRGDIDEFFKELFEEIYPWSGEEIEMPIEWQTQSFDLCVEIDYYKKEEIHPDFKEHWERIFRKIKPFYDL